MKNATPEDLNEALPHIAFELYHFQFYAQIVQSQIDGSCPISQTGLLQATGYAFLMHFRVLLDFFYGCGDKHDDLLVSDFWTLPEFRYQAAARPDWLEQVRIDLNKRLAHLTSSRWKTHPPSMNHSQGRVSEIGELINGFSGSLPTDMRASLEREINNYAARDASIWGQLTFTPDPQTPDFPSKP